MSKKTLIIENLPGDFDDVRMKLGFYFRNKKKSGGEIINISEHPDDKRKGLLVYLDNSDVKDVLERVHRIDFSHLGMVELTVKMHEDKTAQDKRPPPVHRRKGKPVLTTAKQEQPRNPYPVYAEENIAVRSVKEMEFIESCMNLSEIPEIKKHGATIVACGTESSPYLKVTVAKENIREVVNVVKRQLSFISVEKHTYSKAGESKVLKKNEANAKAKAKELHCRLYLLTGQRTCGPTKNSTCNISSHLTNPTSPVQSSIPKQKSNTSVIVHGVLVSLKKGDITKETVDVIVNSNNRNLNLHDGVSGAIFKAAGRSVVDEYKRRSPRLDEVILTGGGNISCKHIAQMFGPANVAEITTSVEKVLKVCESKMAARVAIPAIGTGMGGIVAHESIKAIFTALENHLIQLNSSCLTEITVVAFDPKIWEAYRDYFKERNRKFHLFPHDKTTNQVKIKGVAIELKKGDITIETVQAIVNTTNSAMDNKTGVSGAIFTVAGPSVGIECQKLGPLQSDTVAVTSAGNLHCDFIIHMMGPHSTADARFRVKKVLEQCEEKKISTISFPAVGTGGGGVKGAEAIEAMLQGFEDHFSQCSFTAVELIYIVINQDNVLQEFQLGLKEWITKNQVTEDNDDNAYEESDSSIDRHRVNIKNKTKKPENIGWGPIRDLVMDKKDPVLTQLFDMCGITDEQLNDKKTAKVIYKFFEKQGGVEAIKSQFLREVSTQQQPNSSPAKQPLTLETEMSVVSFPVTTVEVYGTLSAELAMVKKFLNNLISEECTTKEIQSCNPANLLQADKEAIKCISQNNQVHILASSPNKLTVSGMKDDVLEAVLNIYSFVQSANIREIQEIEEKRKRDIYEKEQVVASLCNLLTDTDTAVIQSPPAWAKMDEKNLEIILLTPDSEEHKKIELEFLRSSQHPYLRPFQVLQIRRIQNKGLWQRYAVLKQEVDKKYPTQTNQQFLYHGTTKDICQKINMNGFNRSFCGRNAVVHGEGTYFAKEAWYSCLNQYSNPDESGLKYIYRATVVTGLPCKSRQGMKEPDPLDPNDPRAGLYNCAVDKLQDPSIFVVFCDAGAYPDHLIVFKTI